MNSSMQQENGKNGKYRPQITLIITAFFVIALGIVFFFLIFRAEGLSKAFGHLIDILMPFVYGFAIAYILRPMCRVLEKKCYSVFSFISEKYRKGVSTGAAIAVSYLIFFAIIYFVLAAVLPRLFDSLRVVLKAVPTSTEEFKLWLNHIFESNPQISRLLGSSIDEVEGQIMKWVESKVLPYISQLLPALTSGILSMIQFFADFLIGLVAAAYILAARKRLRAQLHMIIHALLPPRGAEWLSHELNYTDRMFGGFLIGKIVDSAIIGVLCFIGCSLLKIPNTILVSVVVGVTNIIPFFGPYIGMIPSALIICLDSPVRALIFLVFDIILQQIDGNIIGPRILGDRTGLSGLAVLFSIILFGGLWGFAGMIVGVPLFAVIYDILKQIVNWGLRRNGKIILREQYDASFHKKPPVTAEELVERTKNTVRDKRNHHRPNRFQK